MNSISNPRLLGQEPGNESSINETKLEPRVVYSKPSSGLVS